MLWRAGAAVQCIKKRVSTSLRKRESVVLHGFAPTERSTPRPVLGDSPARSHYHVAGCFAGASEVMVFTARLTISCKSSDPVCMLLIPKYMYGLSFEPALSHWRHSIVATQDAKSLSRLITQPPLRP